MDFENFRQQCHHQSALEKRERDQLVVRVSTAVKIAKQEARHKVGLGETPRHLIRKRC